MRNRIMFRFHFDPDSLEVYKNISFFVSFEEIIVKINEEISELKLKYKIPKELKNNYENLFEVT